MSFAVWFKTRESQPECCQPNCPKEIAVEYVKLSEVSVELKRRKLWNSVNQEIFFLFADVNRITSPKLELASFIQFVFLEKCIRKLGTFFKYKSPNIVQSGLNKCSNITTATLLTCWADFF